MVWWWKLRDAALAALLERRVRERKWRKGSSVVAPMSTECSDLELESWSA